MEQSEKRMKNKECFRKIQSSHSNLPSSDLVIFYQTAPTDDRAGELQILDLFSAIGASHISFQKQTRNKQGSHSNS